MLQVLHGCTSMNSLSIFSCCSMFVPGGELRARDIATTNRAPSRIDLAQLEILVARLGSRRRARRMRRELAPLDLGQLVVLVALPRRVQPARRLPARLRQSYLDRCDQAQDNHPAEQYDPNRDDAQMKPAIACDRHYVQSVHSILTLSSGLRIG